MSRGIPFLLISAVACNGPLELDAASEPCTDRERCCPRESLLCTGDADQQIVCHCPGLWDCSASPSKCEQPLPTPDGKAGWSCSWSSAEYVCTRPAGGGAGAGAGWTCTESGSLLRCAKDVAPNPSNSPTGGGAWTCRVDELHAKLRCEQPGQASPPSPPATSPPAAPPSTAPSPAPGQECVPGQRRWCDGELYCGWGQQECTPEGAWPESCVELADGRRPNTACACYHYTFEESCCETADCIVPPGTSGTLCTGGGGKLCDPCNPAQPSCKEPGGVCLVVAGQSFCTRGCSAQQPCPSGFLCAQAGGGHCVPQTLTCPLP